MKKSIQGLLICLGIVLSATQAHAWRGRRGYYRSRPRVAFYGGGPYWGYPYGYGPAYYGPGVNVGFGGPGFGIGFTI
jgi:hypothetical protein